MVHYHIPDNRIWFYTNIFLSRTIHKKHQRNKKLVNNISKCRHTTAT